jgi:hypothetical protein
LASSSAIVSALSWLEVMMLCSFIFLPFF